MDNKLIELISEEIRETKNLTLAVQRETEEIKKSTEEIRRSADAAIKNAAEAQRKADAAWELVIMTREEIKRPFWKKLFSLS